MEKYFRKAEKYFTIIYAIFVELDTVINILLEEQNYFLKINKNLENRNLILSF